VQHALRAYTPQDQKAVKVAADTFRPNPAFKTYETLLELGTGEALVSFLDEKGTPSIVERAKILFPLSQIGAISESERETLIKRSRLYGRYDHPVDRESAYELITAATAADAITGKKSSSKTSTTKKAVTKATRSATSTLTKELTRSILGNLIK